MEEKPPSIPKKSEKLAILPGPYTFARLVRDEKHRKFEELLHELGDALAKVSKLYISKGFEHVLFTEPSLVVSPPKRKEWSTIVECYRKLKKQGIDDLILQTFFGDLNGALPSILDVPATSIGVDFFETEIESISMYDLGKLRFDCGCVDATNSLIERPKDIASFVKRVAKALDLENKGIAPNAPMEYLPRIVADEKLRAIAKAARLLGGD